MEEMKIQFFELVLGNIKMVLGICWGIRMDNWVCTHVKMGIFGNFGMEYLGFVQNWTKFCEFGLKWGNSDHFGWELVNLL